MKDYKVNIFIPLVVFIVFIVFLFIIHKNDSKKSVVSFYDKVDTINIDGVSNYKGRGVVIFNEKFVISTSAKWIEDDCGLKKWASSGPLIDFDSLPHEYTLDDLELPYMFF